MRSSDPNNETGSLDIDMSLGSPIRASGESTAERKREEDGDILEEDAEVEPCKSRVEQESVIKEAQKWIVDLEMRHDELLMLSVKNAVLLDSLAIAGE